MFVNKSSGSVSNKQLCTMNSSKFSSPIRSWWLISFSLYRMPRSPAHHAQPSSPLCGSVTFCMTGTERAEPILLVRLPFECIAFGRLNNCMLYLYILNRSFIFNGTFEAREALWRHTRQIIIWFEDLSQLFLLARSPMDNYRKTSNYINFSLCFRLSKMLWNNGETFPSLWLVAVRNESVRLLSSGRAFMLLSKLFSLPSIAEASKTLSAWRGGLVSKFLFFSVGDLHLEKLKILTELAHKQKPCH